MLTLNADGHLLMSLHARQNLVLAPDKQDKRSVIPIELGDVDQCWKARSQGRAGAAAGTSRRCSQCSPNSRHPQQSTGGSFDMPALACRVGRVAGLQIPENRWIRFPSRNTGKPVPSLRSAEGLAPVRLKTNDNTAAFRSDIWLQALIKADSDEDSGG